MVSTASLLSLSGLKPLRTVARIGGRFLHLHFKLILLSSFFCHVFSSLSTVPVMTFFKDDEEQSLDLDTFINHIKFVASSGVSGIVVLGSTGEAVSLTDEERNLVSGKKRNDIPDSALHHLTCLVSLLFPFPADSHRSSNSGFVWLFSFTFDLWSRWSLNFIGHQIHRVSF